MVCRASSESAQTRELRQLERTACVHRPVAGTAQAEQSRRGFKTARLVSDTFLVLRFSCISVVLRVFELSSVFSMGPRTGEADGAAKVGGRRKRDTNAITAAVQRSKRFQCTQACHLSKVLRSTRKYLTFHEPW